MRKLRAMAAVSAGIMLASTAVFSACGDKGPTPPDGFDGTAISFYATYVNEYSKDAYNELVETYNNTQGKEDNVYVEMTPNTGAVGNLKSILTGKSSRYDVVMITNDTFKGLAMEEGRTEGGVLVNLESYLTDEVKESMDWDSIPESLLKKEGELVEGFAPEVAWVTAGGSEPLEERLAVRPTSETMFSDHFAHVLHSYRDLPMLYNQWCSVVRWEKSTRPFLRTREFWWQEGHTIHETAAEAEAETAQQLECYADFCERDLCIPVLKGRKTDKEKFAGAEATYTIEAMMKDGKALQSGTSHYFGDKFSRAYDVTFTGRDNTLQYPFQTSWGASSRLIGAIIMTHGDDDGLILPPAIAPIQVVIVPVAAHKPGVTEKAQELAAALRGSFRVKVDDSDKAPGWKFSQWEMKGVPLAPPEARTPPESAAMPAAKAA